MGMYDVLTCQYPLPEGYAEMQNREFQTKSFDSLLEHYTITPAGELWITRADRDWVEDSSSVLGGYSRTIRQWEERVEDYHGDAYFYDFHNPEIPRDLVTFRARFTHGILESIIVVLDRK